MYWYFNWLQDKLGEVVFVQLPEVGQTLEFDGMYTCSVGFPFFVILSLLSHVGLTYL